MPAIRFAILSDFMTAEAKQSSVNLSRSTKTNLFRWPVATPETAGLRGVCMAGVFQETSRAAVLQLLRGKSENRAHSLDAGSSLRNSKLDLRPGDFV